MLFESYKLGGIELKNRVIMAPLTRCRAINGNVPNALMAEYYGQRAGAGLIIAEGTSPSPNGLGYTNIPGCFNEAHVKGWQLSTKAVHDNGGRIFLQMMHTGRIAHEINLPEGSKVVGASAIAQPGEISTYDGTRHAYPVPEALSEVGVKKTINEYIKSAKLAVEAGFDGVEIHASHGYLPNQFINSASNQRDDQYGKLMKNRCRFVLEIAEKMCRAIGKEKVGIRLSPYSYADVNESPNVLDETYLYLAEELNKLGLVYLHLSHLGEPEPRKFKLWQEIRKVFTGTLILCGDYTQERAEKALANGEADLIAFGRDYIANPDLAERMEAGHPLAPQIKNQWYGDGAKGYTDYPKYDEVSRVN